jgi:hypothetical protein
MTNKRMESVAWILIYSGMLLAALGWAVDGQGSVVGKVMMVAGALDACAGVGLIWWRSRRKDEETR